MKLPVKNEEYDQGMNGTVAGWGQTDDVSKVIANRKHSLHLQVHLSNLPDFALLARAFEESQRASYE